MKCKERTMKRCASRLVSLLVIGLLICLLMLVLPVAAEVEPDWFLNAESAIIDLSISSQLGLERKSSSAYLQSLDINLSFVPRDDERQDVLSVEAFPEADIADTVLFSWQNPADDVFTYELQGTVATRDGFVRVQEKVPFPLERASLPEYASQFLDSTGNIDADDDRIIRLSSAIVEGHDDAYIVVGEIGEWIKDNVEYSLDTLTAEVSQKASWVLINRYGVCDEITSLFIALLRSVGIPARYVSGIAYTNYNDINDFGPHAWAEVYLPNVGWIPYDITYGQFSRVDTGHVKLKTSADSDEPSARYTWTGHDVRVTTQKLETDASVRSAGPSLASPLSFTVEAHKDEVGFGSYNLIEVKITNNNDYYVPAEFIISRTEGLVLQEADRQVVIMEPDSEKSIFWQLRVAPDLTPGYVYTFPVSVVPEHAEPQETRFTALRGGQMLSKGETALLLAQFSEEEKKRYSRNVDFSCVISKDEFYIGEEQQISCELTNTGNTYLEDVQVCLNDCAPEGLVDRGLGQRKTVAVGISQSQAVTFTVSYNEPGRTDAILFASSEDITKTVTMPLFVMDRPVITIANVSYPDTLRFNQFYKVGFLLRKESVSDPQGVHVILTQDDLIKDWDVEVLEDNREFVLNLNAQELSSVETPTTITVRFKDQNGDEYTVEESFVISLSELSFFDRIVMFFNRIGRNLDTFDLKVLIIVAFATGSILGYVLHLAAKRRREALERDYANLMEKKVAEHKVAGNKVAGNKVAGNKVAGNKVAGNKVAGNKVAGQKVVKEKEKKASLNRMQPDAAKLLQP